MSGRNFDVSGRGMLLGVLVLVATVVSAQSVDKQSAVSPALSPSPELSPGQVVKIQLNALRHNDAENRGIAIAFRFASPDNKVNTGPLARFADMIQQGPYGLMLAYDNVSYHPIEVQADRARQRVTLVGAGLVIDYEFYLSRQHDGACQGCWMTDAVVAKRPSGLQVQS